MQQRERLAELAVVAGANVQPGQIVRVSADVVHVDLVRAVADAAYRRGASVVELDLEDALVQRSRVVHARGEPVAHVANWREAGIRELDAAGGARVMIHGPSTQGLFDGLAPARVDAARAPRSRAWREVEYRVNSTIIPGPNPAWASALHPGLAPERALATLWEQIAAACRLGEPEPARAWRERFAQLRRRAGTLTELRLDAVRLRGPGTDLEIGLLPTARWDPPTNVNERGVEHAWNLPSEEIYTSPDPMRADGRVALTRPAVVGGRLVPDVSLTFEAGRVVTVTGGDGVEALRAYLARDAGTSRLGELALVDRDGAVGAVGQTFGMILLDENAASHVALGFGFPELVDPSDRDRVNRSGDHLDVTVGSRRVKITGIDSAGHEHPLLTEGRWSR